MYYFLCHDKKCLVPSGSPVNLTITALSSTHVELEWKPPEFIDRNGIIRQYIVIVSNQKESLSITTSVTHASISALRPFTSYRISVTAVTIGAGPESEAIAVQTLSAGKHAQFCTKVNCLNNLLHSI